MEVDFRYIDTVKHKGRKNDIKCQFGQRSDFQMIFLIHQITDGNEDKERENIVGDNLQKCHDYTPAGKRYRASRKAQISAIVPMAKL